MRNGMQVRYGSTGFQAADEGGEKVIEGYFAVFGSPYEMMPGVEEYVDPGAFADQLGGDVRALVDHETRLVLGRTSAGTLELKTDERGLWGRVRINPDDTDALNLYARVKRGDVSQCSFGFDILDEVRSDEGGKVRYTIRKVKLYEVSVVTFPAYEATEVAARAATIRQDNKRQTDAWREKMKARLKKTC